MKRCAAVFLLFGLSPFLGAMDKTKTRQAAPAPGDNIFLLKFSYRWNT
jgi:hypothetical protein